ncbi:MAG: YdcF family protein [Elsteraceae bacterium]
MARPLGARSKAGRIRTGLVVAGLLSVAAVGVDFWRFAAGLPMEPAERERKTDAIVVLTGGSERVRTGFQLLAEGLAPRLFFSGVGKDVEARALAGADLVDPSKLACCVALGRAAADTAGNATETAGYAAGIGLRSIRLVTASYHMPRSLLQFRHALPQVQITPHPVFPAGFKHVDWWQWPGSAGLVAGEYVKWRYAWISLMVQSLGGWFEKAGS